MTTKRHDLEENREAFKDEKNKETFEAEIDKNREKVAHEKEKKAEKRFDREHK
ncbi:hypothetical protein [Vagococcus penaei]|uniref:hypothetical protein n=1 Tax=Vagococcus penaei TaxID=633807 RepID=UPI001372E585|nr:hypothetical protein [Vagococcus penaei]